jgi:hypothetical protein
VQVILNSAHPIHPHLGQMASDEGTDGLSINELKERLAFE